MRQFTAIWIFARLVTERRKMTTYPCSRYDRISGDRVRTGIREETQLTRTIPTETVRAGRKRRA